jgi:hypothetical protein
MAQQLRVIITRAGEYVTAQGLEYDIGAQARDLDTLRKRFVATVAAEREESERRHGTPFQGIDPAPQYFYDLWEHRVKMLKPASAAGVDIEFAIAG